MVSERANSIPHQRVSKAMNIQPVSKIIEDTENSDDSIIKLTGRLEQVFLTSN